MEILSINRNSPFPLYYQLKELLLGKIQRGEWKPGEQIPTEEEIQMQYEISRTTVRQALRELELDGKISRQAGKGTFVTHPKIQEGTESYDLDALELDEKGLQLVWKVIYAEEIDAPAEVAARLQVAPGERVFSLKRLRMANGSAIGYVETYIAKPFIPYVDLAQAESGGTMNYLRAVGLERYIAERTVEALPAERETAKILEIERGFPVLVLTRVLRDESDRPVEFFRGYYRGDRFRYHIQKLPAQV